MRSGVAYDKPVDVAVMARRAAVMTSTASWSDKPSPMHGECQVQNEAAWPITARVWFVRP